MAGFSTHNTEESQMLKQLETQKSGTFPTELANLGGQSLYPTTIPTEFTTWKNQTQEDSTIFPNGLATLGSQTQDSTNFQTEFTNWGNQTPDFTTFPTELDIMGNQTQDSTTFATELANWRSHSLYNTTFFTEWGSHRLDSTGGYLVPAASMDQSQPAVDNDDVMKKLLEDSKTDNFDLFGDGINTEDLEMLRTFLVGDGSSPP